MTMVSMPQDSAAPGQIDHCRRLAHVLSLTKKMLSLAEDGQWEQVAEREMERREDLAACFENSSVTGSDAEVFAEAMAALLHLNEELMAKLKVARDLVMEEGRKHTRNRNALGSYRDVGATH
ncbi:MAG: flagellar protein FliT [Halioglobus sp.]